MARVARECSSGSCVHKMENQKDEIFRIKETFIQFIPFLLLSKISFWGSIHSMGQQPRCDPNDVFNDYLYLFKISIHQRSIHLTLRVDIHFVYLFFSCFFLSPPSSSPLLRLYLLYFISVALPKHLKHMNRGSTSMMEFMKPKLKKKKTKNLFFVFDKCHFTLK